MEKKGVTSKYSIIIGRIPSPEARKEAGVSIYNHSLTTGDGLRMDLA